MDQLRKETLTSEVTELEKAITSYQRKLLDFVRVYKRIIKEKEALELRVKALQNVCQTEEQPANNQTTSNLVDVESSPSTEPSKEQENVNSLDSEFTILMNSLSTLTIANCIEASFHAEQKLIRQEKEKHELIIKELQDKLKKLTFESSKEIEQLKSRLIIEKHKREIEEIDNLVMVSVLKRLLSQVKEDKINLEKQLAEMATLHM